MHPATLARSLRQSVLSYLRATLDLRDSRLDTALFDFLGGEDGLFKGPYLDLRLPFRQAEDDAETFLEVRPPFTPYAHQQRAWERLHSGEGHQPQHTLVTTGTGSGKTECFLYPLLDHCRRTLRKPGIKAIILYPMNALATDQARRLAKELATHPLLNTGDERVTAGLYVGGKGKHGAASATHLIDQRDLLRQAPPDILLTNYKMLDYLLVRPEDAPLFAANGPHTLRYLVLDELHTFDGAQGSDVACLIRRLRARLKTPPNALTCVGTSATVGGDRAGRKALVRFACEVFGERIGNDAVIGEERYTADEFLAPMDADAPLPTEGDAERLAVDTHPTPDDYLEAQAALWLSRPTLDPVALGTQLRAHPLLHRLLSTLRGRQRPLAEVIEGLTKRDVLFRALPDALRPLALDSFLSLLAHAKTDTDGFISPLLSMQVQLWVRELRRLMRKVPAKLGEPPAFAWNDTLRAEVHEHWLPIVHCRECGASGFGAMAPEDTKHQQLKDSAVEVGRAWMRRDHHLRFVIPGHLPPDGSFPLYLDHQTLRFDIAPQRDDGTHKLPVIIGSEATDTPPKRSRMHCPICDNAGALRILGGRAATLGSVLVGQTFASRYNADKKMLAFTDSVQDAAHRAGFFGARTFRFNMRTAIQSVVSAHSGASLEALGQMVLDHWGNQLETTRLITALMPADLFDLPSYQRFLKDRGEGNTTRLLGDLAERINWELTREYAQGAGYGRSLERAGCSVASPDEARLKHAAERFHLVLKEELNLPRLNALRPEQTRHFLEGLVSRTQRRGGVFHPFLEAFIAEKGKWFQLNKRRQPLMSPVGSRTPLPKFLVDRPFGKVFETYNTPPNTLTWYRDWARRSLGVPAGYAAVQDIYRIAAQSLTAARVYDTREIAKATVYGLRPDALVVTTAVKQLACTACGARHARSEAMAARWAGQRCPGYRCMGTLADTQDPPDFYARRYTSGDLQRVFAAEHTGLLARDEREQLEERFKAGTEPDAPNLLVATPTLEMGIDVGDLSAVLLCSVPPATANYLQRIGRAGRKTGNALCLTLANARPHDQYFFAEPEEMMAGSVAPPGCFLDAPEMLKRQVVAHAMDRWAGQAVGASIPWAAKAIDPARPDGFPGSFTAYYRTHHAALTREFLGLFAAKTLSDRNRERIRAYGLDDGPTGPAGRVQQAFEDLAEERRQLSSTRKRMNADALKLEAQGGLSFEDEERLVSLQEGAKVLARLREELGRKYPLNVLTDAGVLPNYAFPEPGVTLRSVVTGIKPKGNTTSKKKKKPNYIAKEFVRPGQAALRELAPFNAFYADGRHVEINQLDVGTKARPLIELWRFCSACHHQQRVPDLVTSETQCPRCCHPTWPDAGQVRAMLLFRKSQSLAALLTSRVSDDSDERQTVEYRTEALIDVGPSNWGGGHVVEAMPFGFERLHDVTLREVNFGPTFATDNHPVEVASNSIAQAGFDVCLDCGRVRDPRGDKPLRHAPYCTFGKPGKAGKAERIQRLYLYRQVTSEAIRMLLPLSTVAVECIRASFQAALALGLRRRFQGNPGHLMLRFASEPIQTDHTLKRRFMVLYDGVPGGSGYLAELARPEQLREVFTRALDAMQSCRCRDDEQKDGCYRCLLAYQPQRDLQHISQQSAIEQFEAIVANWGQLEPVKTLSEVQLDAKLESELEERFVLSLAAKAASTEGASWETTTHHGDRCWLLTLGAFVWRVEPQVELGTPEDGVAIQCRPDFVLKALQWPKDHPEPRRIAVFCDGLAFHAQPADPMGRIGDDVRKRSAILERDFWVWSVTWKDVERFEGKKAAGEPTALEAVPGGRIGMVRKKLNCALPTELARLGSMALLFAFLRDPNAAQWALLARSVAIAGLLKPPLLSNAASDQWAQHIVDAPERFDAPTEQANAPKMRAWGWHGDWASLLIRALPNGEVSSIQLRLFDEWTGRQSDTFEASWRAALHAWNLFQFTEKITAHASTLIDGEPVVARAPAPATTVTDLSVFLADLDPDAHPLMQAIEAAALPWPEPGYMIRSPDGLRELGDIELAWPDAQLAVYGDWQADALDAFTGWTLLPLTDPVPDLIERLAAHLGAPK